MYAHSDKILLNLKIISKIPNYGRVRRDRHGVITIETSDMFTPLRRYFFSDGREQSVVDIMNIVLSAFTEIRSIIHDMPNYGNGRGMEGHDNVDSMFFAMSLIRELKACKLGVSNLRNTYANDVKTTAGIDMIIDKIDSFMTSMKTTFDGLLPATRDLPCSYESSEYDAGEPRE